MTQRSVIWIALAFAFIGGVLKLADFSHSRPSEPAPATEPHSAASHRPPATDGATARSSRSRPDEVGASGAVAADPDDDRRLAREDRAHDGSSSRTVESRSGAATANRMEPEVHAFHRFESRRARAPRHGGRAGGGGLRAGAVGAEGGAVLDAPSPAGGGTMAGAPTAAGGANGKGAPTPGQPATPTDVVYASGETEQYPTNGQVEVPDVSVSGRSGTLSFWMQPTWGAGSQDDASLVMLGDRMQVIKNVNFLRFEWQDDNNIEGGLGMPITDWKPGDWHQVTTTWAGNQFSLYVDGKLIGQANNYAGNFALPDDTRLYVGSDFPASRPVASGTIGGVDLRNRSMAAGEVANQYAQALAGKSQPGHK